MKYQPQTIYHIYNQGNNLQLIFFQEENYLYFLRKMRTHLLPYVDILCYCLMPNHFHWLVCTKDAACLPSNAVKPRQLFRGGVSSQSSDDFKSPDDYSNRNINDYQQNLSQAIATLLRSYTRAINKQENRSGSLFRKTKSKSGIIDGCITVDGKHKDLFFKPDNSYAMICFDYIHQNPVKAQLCLKPEDWRYSSAKDYAGLWNGTLCNQELARQLLF